MHFKGPERKAKKAKKKFGPFSAVADLRSGDKVNWGGVELPCVLTWDGFFETCGMGFETLWGEYFAGRI